MKRVKAFALVMASLFVVGVMTSASASAETESLPLPDIHTALPKETYPLNLGGKLASRSKLLNEVGTGLEANELSVLLSIKELTSLGPITVDFLGIEEPKEKTKCNTEGDPEGAVLLPNGEFHLVYYSYHPLRIALLILFSKFALTCGLVKTTVTGPLTSQLIVEEGNSGTQGDITDMQAITHCGSTLTAIQEIPFYYNDSFEEVPSTLLANFFGTGNQKACEEIAGTLLLTPETGSLASMFTVLY